MIVTSFSMEDATTGRPSTGEEHAINSEQTNSGTFAEQTNSGTFAGAGSFRCRSCGYVLTLTGVDKLTDCPGCGGQEFVRASLFSDALSAEGQETQRHGDVLSEPEPPERELQLSRARSQIEQAGEYLCYCEGGETRTIALTREWTRIGRSLAADVRFDDPTVSRRHALIVRQPDGVRVLDDRSLNGVFVNEERIEGRVLKDGDEIIVGRYRLHFFEVAAEPASKAGRVEKGSPGGTA